MSANLSTAEVAQDLSKALADLSKAEAEHAARKADSDAARRAETDALNKLNQVQAKIDRMIDALRDTRHGDWASRKHVTAHLGYCGATSPRTSPDPA